MSTYDEIWCLIFDFGQYCSLLWPNLREKQDGQSLRQRDVIQAIFLELDNGTNVQEAEEDLNQALLSPNICVAVSSIHRTCTCVSNSFSSLVCFLFHTYLTYLKGGSRLAILVVFSPPGMPKKLSPLILFQPTLHENSSSKLLLLPLMSAVVPL